MSIIVECQACNKRNRIPSGKAFAKVTCGACGHVITEEVRNQANCWLCRKSVTTGVNLSDGGIVHSMCLESLQNSADQTYNDYQKKQQEFAEFQRDLDRREGIIFKIGTIFSQPKYDTHDIEEYIPKLNKKIKDLEKMLTRIDSSLTHIYDYFLTYPPDWDSRRSRVANRDGSLCSKCRSTSHLHLHHIKPLSKGGSNKISNLKFLCETCHSREHGGRDFSDEYTESETAYSKRVRNIRLAIKQGRKIKFGYKKPSDKGYKQRTVDPTELVNVDHERDSGSTLCVRGYCHLRNDKRIFALKRMRGLKVL